MDYLLIFVISFLTGALTYFLLYFIFRFIDRMRFNKHAEYVISDFKSRHFFTDEDLATYLRSLPLNDLCIILERYGLALSHYIAKGDSI